MRLEGFLIKPKKNEKYWSVDVPSLGIYTQGTSKKDGYLMAKDAIESLIEKKDFEVTITPKKGMEFSVTASDPKLLIALVLKRQRESRGLSVMEVARRLKSNSPNTYWRYETGKVMPNFGQLCKLLRAISPDLEPTLKIG